MESHPARRKMGKTKWNIGEIRPCRLRTENEIGPGSPCRALPKPVFLKYFNKRLLPVFVGRQRDIQDFLVILVKVDIFEVIASIRATTY